MSKILDDLVAAQLMPEPKPEPVVHPRRMYAAARGSRFNVGLGSSGDSSADTEINSSLTRLRASARQIIRDAPYARRARKLFVNNVIGPGIGMQGQVTFSRATDLQGGVKMNARINDAIERAWCEWSEPEYCHTGGVFHFHDMERAAAAELFTAGEVFLREHPIAFGDGKIPLALEFIEAERIATDSTQPGPMAPNAVLKMGIEVDRFDRPLAIWIRRSHPGDLRANVSTRDSFERVPAEQVYHLHIVERWPQTRGEPMMHAVIRKLDSMDQYTGSELQAAQADAYHFGTITSSAVEGGPLSDNLSEQQNSDAKPEMQIENGVVNELAPGETMDYHHPTRPNTALDPFLRYMLREVASGTDVSYESLSRDYSQSNYSSSRLALLDDRDVWRVLQRWWLRNFRMPLHKRWLMAAVMAGAIPEISLEAYALNPERYEAVKFKCRGWSWISPKDDVAAYKEAEKAGYVSAEDVIAETGDGMDIEDVVAGMVRSRDLYAAAGIERDTDVAQINAAKAAAAAPAPMPQPAPPPPARSINITMPDITVNQGDTILQKGMVDHRTSVVTPEVQVTVQPPDIHLRTGDVNLPEMQVNVASPNVTVEPAEVHVRAGDVNLPPSVHNVTVESKPATTLYDKLDTTRVIRDAGGNIERIVKESVHDRTDTKRIVRDADGNIEQIITEK